MSYLLFAVFIRKQHRVFIPEDATSKITKHILVLSPCIVLISYIPVTMAKRLLT